MKNPFVEAIKTAIGASRAVAEDGLSGIVGYAWDELKSVFWDPVTGAAKTTFQATAGQLWSFFKYLFHELYYVLFDFIFPDTFSLASSAGVEFVGFCEKAFGGSASMDFIYYLFGFTIIIFFVKLIMKIVK